MLSACRCLSPTSVWHFAGTGWTFLGERRFLEADANGGRRDLRRKYQAMRPGARLVGISWRSSNHEVGWLKGQDLLAWAPILSVVGNVAFVNLQYGDCREESVVGPPDARNLISSRTPISIRSRIWMVSPPRSAPWIW